MKKKKEFKDAKIVIVCSSGGHLTHMMMIKKVWENNERFFCYF